MSQQNHQLPDYSTEGNGAFPPAYHTDMLRDHTRIEPFRKALEMVIQPGTKVLECGCGTGILSIIAAKLGAQVTAIEVDPNIARHARENFIRHDLDIKLIEGDARSLDVLVSKDDRYDVVMAELMSIWCIDEPQVPVVNQIRKSLLRPQGTVIPGRIFNLIAFGHFNFGNELVQCRVPMARFTGVPDATLFSGKVSVNELDFSSQVPLEMSGVVELKSLVSGTINCVQISSIVELVPNVNFYTSDTLMPVTIVPLQRDIHVNSGELVQIEYTYRHRSNLEAVHFKASVM